MNVPNSQLLLKFNVCAFAKLLVPPVPNLTDYHPSLSMSCKVYCGNGLHENRPGDPQLIAYSGDTYQEKCGANISRYFEVIFCVHLVLYMQNTPIQLEMSKTSAES